jgi:Flp pilus assembly protein TadB
VVCDHYRGRIQEKIAEKKKKSDAKEKARSATEALEAKAKRLKTEGTQGEVPAMFASSSVCFVCVFLVSASSLLSLCISSQIKAAFNLTTTSECLIVNSPRPLLLDVGRVC